MKKTKLILLCGIMLLSLTGCGSGNQKDTENKNNKEIKEDDTVLIRCGNGNVNISVHYSEYKVKGTEILEFKVYDEKIYESKKEMESKYEFYKELDVYDIEKIDDTHLKLITRDPLNVYELADSKLTYKEIIEDYEKDGNFCQISEDGKTFETLESNLSKEDNERNGWASSLYEIKEYDSEVFYTNDANISYKMLDGFKTEEKNLSKKKTTEIFKNLDGDIYRIEVTVEDIDNHCYEKDGHKRGADSASYRKRKFDLDYDLRNKATDIKTTTIDDYNVYYYAFDDFLVSESAITYMFFEIDDNYVIEIEIHYNSKTKYDDIKDNDLKSFEDLIKSFKFKKI